MAAAPVPLIGLLFFVLCLVGAYRLGQKGRWA
jgi:hypothetical protein